MVKWLRKLLLKDKTCWVVYRWDIEAQMKHEIIMISLNYRVAKNFCDVLNKTFTEEKDNQIFIVTKESYVLAKDKEDAIIKVGDKYGDQIFDKRDIKQELKETLWNTLKEK